MGHHPGPCALVILGLVAAGAAPSACSIDGRELSVAEPGADAGIMHAAGGSSGGGSSGVEGSAGRAGSPPGPLQGGSGGAAAPAAEGTGAGEPLAGDATGAASGASQDGGLVPDAADGVDVSIPDACASVLCVHGTCSTLDGLAVCSCAPGHDGLDCATDIDECAARPCANGGRCIDGEAAFTCDCSGLAFAGPRCSEARFGPLPSLPGLGTALPRAVSADGSSIVGNVIDGETLTGSFRWTPADGYFDLTPVMGSSVRDMSDDGAVLLGVEIGPGGDRSFAWSEATGPIALPTPPGLPRCAAERLAAGGGRIAGTCFDEERRIWNAVRWTVQDGVASVDVLPNSLGGNQSEGRAIDAAGTTIVGTSFAGGGLATLWIMDGESLPRAEDLGLLPNPGRYPTARALSADGRVVAGDDGSNAFIWTAELGMRLLPQPVPSDIDAVAAVNDMDASGSVIVGCLVPASAGTAFETLIWDVDGAHRLRDILVDAGVAASALRDWTLNNALAISADGGTIVGIGVDPSGQRSGWVARLR
jgi:uncharacterized membrane protein